MTLAIMLLILISSFNAWKVMKMGTMIEELKQTVTEMGTVVDSAVEMINGIADKIDQAISADDASEDGELSALSASLREDATRLGDAVAANTMAATETPPADPEPMP